MLSTTAGIKCFGPNAGGRPARRLEGLHQGSVRASSAFRPRPMAASRTRRAPRRIWLRQSCPIVVKADGLAAGKGVIIATTRAEAEAAIDACFAGAFGAAGSRGRHRGIPRRRGGELLRARRRHARAGAGDGAGSQARRRRRHRPQHRRHGRLLAGAGHDAGDDRAHDARDHRARPSPPWPSAARRSRACCSPA